MCTHTQVISRNTGCACALIGVLSPHITQIIGVSSPQIIQRLSRGFRIPLLPSWLLRIILRSVLLPFIIAWMMVQTRPRIYSLVKDEALRRLGPPPDLTGKRGCAQDPKDRRSRPYEVARSRSGPSLLPLPRLHLRLVPVHRLCCSSNVCRGSRSLHHCQPANSVTAEAASGRLRIRRVRIRRGPGILIPLVLAGPVRAEEG